LAEGEESIHTDELKMGKKLYVGNLSFGTTSKDLDTATSTSR